MKDIAQERLRGLLLVLLISLAAMWTAEANSQTIAQWKQFDLPVYYDSRNAPRDISADMDYALKLWSDRTDFDLDFRGSTKANHITGAIVIRWDASLNVTGRAIRYYSLSDGWVNHAVVLLNPNSWLVYADNYRNVIAHEMGHAIGIRGHNGAGNLMSADYWLMGSNLTVDDLAMLERGDVYPCHPELTHDNDLWFPAVFDGESMVSALLNYSETGGQVRWSVGATQSVDYQCDPLPEAGGRLILNRVWSVVGEWYAELIWQDGDFVLYYAEER